MESTNNSQPNPAENENNQPNEAASFNTDEQTKVIEAIDQQENALTNKQEEDVDPIEYYGL
ncbi:hypothetical protein EOD41_17505 [Mucilaginibacter limnophilus]|uniref:Uncharacterized protein n=1 Tax=Mucilaginibacter limnophilus TaxID=1932778 RepID=A0A3S2VKJ6_9SPHI|nr:hypothetical protein [Mucilaginibacter limnophilus]RVT98168.1 hypothetical protein EOD41_17505 [Mucilaginibacter limnophilus]